MWLIPSYHIPSVDSARYLHSVQRFRDLVHQVCELFRNRLFFACEAKVSQLPADSPAVLTQRILRPRQQMAHHKRPDTLRKRHGAVVPCYRDLNQRSIVDNDPHFRFFAQSFQLHFLQLVVERFDEFVPVGFEIFNLSLIPLQRLVLVGLEILDVGLEILDLFLIPLQRLVLVGLEILDVGLEILDLFLIPLQRFVPLGFEILDLLYILFVQES